MKEASEFIYYVESNNYNKTSSKFDRNFASVNDIDMKSIKLYYLKILKNIIPSFWNKIYDNFILVRTKRVKFNHTNVGKTGEPISRTNSVSVSEPNGSCGIYVTTKDAYTLTDGPTIFLANDLQKVSKFCIQQANIPAVVMKDITDKIEYNNKINERIVQFEKELEFEETRVASKLTGSSNDTSKEANKLSSKKDKKGKSKIAGKMLDKTGDRKISKMRDDIETLKTMVKNATLDDMFIPNKLTHLEKWAKGLNTSAAFTSNIDDSIIVSIMLLTDVDDSWKILLLLGIGVFTEHRSSDYTEIMKKLADQQKLYLIIADSDYIYGTNYQFCHGYLSKDLELTQEKIIQALGRIGRNNIQQEYSARFRDDLHIKTLFTRFESENKPEVINMNKLFNSKNVKWNGLEYEELPEEELNIQFDDSEDTSGEEEDDEEEEEK